MEELRRDELIGEDSHDRLARDARLHILELALVEALDGRADGLGECLGHSDARGQSDTSLNVLELLLVEAGNGAAEVGRDELRVSDADDGASVDNGVDRLQVELALIDPTANGGIL